MQHLLDYGEVRRGWVDYSVRPNFLFRVPLPDFKPLIAVKTSSDYNAQVWC